METLMDELAEAYLDHNMECWYYLDLHTGTVISDMNGELLDEYGIDLDDEENDERYLQIPKIDSHEAYHVRVKFAQYTDKDPADRLFDALNGNKPFRRFKDALYDLNLWDDWNRYEREYADEQINWWLEQIKLIYSELEKLRAANEGKFPGAEGAAAIKNGERLPEEADIKSIEKIKEQQTTYELYAEMPDDGQRYEIFDGALEAMSPGAGATHQAVSGELEYLLKNGCRSEYRIYDAPFDVILDQTNVLQPDIMMIHRSRSHLVTERGIEGPPDLVVEVLSPSSGNRDSVRKRQVYERFGVAEYWIVDPAARTLEQLHLQDGRYESRMFAGRDRVTSDKLPCVSFAVSDIFREVLQ